MQARFVSLIAGVVLLAGCSAAPSVPSAPATGVSGVATAAPTPSPASPTLAPTFTAAPPATTRAAPSTSTIAPSAPTAVPPTSTAVPSLPTTSAVKSSGCKVSGALPDAFCTPGAVLNVTAAQVCVSGYALSVRDVPESEKEQVYRAYGILSRTAGQYEVDHLISLELGGSNEIANLWPEAAEPRPGFHEKDQVENYLHEQVCSGKVSLAVAQQQIAKNWLAVYQELPGHGAAAASQPTAARATPATPAPVARIAPSATIASVVPAGHTFYLSTYRTAHEYYCDDDPRWKSLSPKYLVHLSTEAEVHTEYPGYTLHRPC